MELGRGVAAMQVGLLFTSAFICPLIVTFKMDGCTRIIHGLGLVLHPIPLVEGALRGGGDGLEGSGTTQKRIKKPIKGV